MWGKCSKCMKQITQDTIEIIKAASGKYMFEVAKDRCLTLFDLALNENALERCITVNLRGEGAEVKIYSIFFGSNEQSFSLAHIVRHLASRTVSKIETKGVLQDKAAARYSALIDITKGSTGCRGEQSEHTLLLSDKARITAVPALEIANNDVKASHSVAITYIDDIKKFYLESRGLTEKEAVKAIVHGHFAEVLNQIGDSELRSGIEKRIAQKLC